MGARVLDVLLREILKKKIQMTLPFAASRNIPGETLMPIRAVVPPHSNGYCKANNGVCPSGFLPLLRIWDEINRTSPVRMSGYAQNVGANDGVADDPLYPLIKHRGINALAIESDPALFANLQNNMKAFRGVVSMRAAIAPSNATKVLAHRSGSNTIDVLKIDIDGCECHILDRLLASRWWYRPKIIQIELNHILPPPVAYKDMCANDAPGRSAVPYESNLDVWGCSMQAAYDIVRPHGYRLLQYDWPDAVFIHEVHVAAFPFVPWLEPEDFHAAYWHGRAWADKYYGRMKQHVTDAQWVRSMMGSLSDAMLLPQRWILDRIVTRWAHTWRKRPLWLEIGIAGTGVAARIECTTDHPKALYRGYVPRTDGADECTQNGPAISWTHWTAKVMTNFSPHPAALVL